MKVPTTIKPHHSTTAKWIVLLLLMGSRCAFALNAENPLIALPDTLSLQTIERVQPSAVFNVVTGEVRLIPTIKDASQTIKDDLVKSMPNGSYALIQNTMDPNTLKPGLACDCDAVLDTNEYLISEVPVMNSQLTGYVSVNDESYKAVMELIDYPHVHPELITVSFSELSYVYHQDAIEQFLNEKGFELIKSWGFMNSSNYPGVLDTQFFITKHTAQNQFYLVIRGTSGGADVTTSTRVNLVDWGRHGKALQGYAEVATHVWTEIQPYLASISTQEKPLIVTGHSLGGAISILTAIKLLDNSIPYRVYGYAPAPIGDIELYDHYQDLMASHVTNYFLPNEELLATQQDRAQRYIRLLGTKKLLTDVGTTAGAAHFVINYLKSMLLDHGYSRQWYEHSMPHCVVVKYPCFAASDYGSFADNIARYVPVCAFTHTDCRDRAQLHLDGFLRDRASPAQLKRLANNKKLLMVENRFDHHQLALLYWQLGRIYQELNDTTLAERFEQNYQHQLQLLLGKNEKRPQ